MVRILVADDHPVVRKGIRQIFADTTDLVVADEAVNGQDVMKKVSRNNYDLLLLDITMPGSSGTDIVPKLKTLRPKLPILVLSIHPEKQYATRLLKLGVSGYLTKDRAPNELVQAIRKVSRGEKYITSSLAEILAINYEVGMGKTLHETLSNREFEVMIMIANGKSIKEIAKDLSLSRKTINVHRLNILKKMQIKNNSELIHYAINNHLID